jgi:hypothetical protein
VQIVAAEMRNDLRDVIAVVAAMGSYAGSLLAAARR